MARTISHSQYEELREYDSPDGLFRARWVNGGPLASLVNNGYIKPTAHDRNMYELTDDGFFALTAYRSRWGVKA